MIPGLQLKSGCLAFQLSQLRELNLAKRGRLEKPECISSLRYSASGAGGPSPAERLPGAQGQGHCCSHWAIHCKCLSSFKAEDEVSLPATLPVGSCENKECFCPALPHQSPAPHQPKSQLDRCLGEPCIYPCINLLPR